MAVLAYREADAITWTQARLRPVTTYQETASGCETVIRCRQRVR